MIAFDLDYLRPESLAEALEAWKARSADALYYAGGTEIHTGARSGSYKPGLLIDLKGIPELSAMGRGGAGLFFGATLSLSELVDQAAFPLLAETARGVADRTVRNRLTLGGNAAGRLPWREALLPFLAADGVAHLAAPGEAGVPALRDIRLRDLHAKRLALGKGELLLGLSVSREAALAPHHRVRCEAGARVDYPLVSLCAVARGGTLSVAVSGAFDHPAWASGESASVTASSFPRFRSDQRGSAEYRAALFDAALTRAKEVLA
jgi:xanthine dehydrogenase molybdenum-binding subunit